MFGAVDLGVVTLSLFVMSHSSCSCSSLWSALTITMYLTFESVEDRKEDSMHDLVEKSCHG